MARRGAKLSAVHHALVVLDPNPDRERLLDETRAAVVQHVEGVTGAVASRQDEGLGSELLVPSVAPSHNATQLFVFAEDDIGEPRPETHLAAERLDLLAKSPHDPGEAVCADVRLRLPEDLLGGTSTDERLQDAAASGVVGVGGELAVREGPRPALTKLDVRVRVEHAVADEGAHRPDARVHRGTALEHEWPRTGPRQREGREQPRRAGAHDDGAHSRGGRQARDGGQRSGDSDGDVVVPDAVHDSYLIFVGRIIERHTERDNEVDVALATGVDRTPEQAYRGDSSLVDAQTSRGRTPQLILCRGTTG